MWGHGSLPQVLVGGFLLHLVMGTVYTYVRLMESIDRQTGRSTDMYIHTTHRPY